MPQGVLSLEFKVGRLPVMIPAELVATVRAAVRLWFSIGVVASCVVCCGFVVALAWNLTHAFTSTASLQDASAAVGQHMAPIVPGVNVPVTDIGLLLAAIACAAAVVSCGMYAFLHCE